jgi:hypothetical protein
MPPSEAFDPSIAFDAFMCAVIVTAFLTFLLSVWSYDDE